MGWFGLGWREGREGKMQRTDRETGKNTSDLDHSQGARKARKRKRKRKRTATEKDTIRYDKIRHDTYHSCL